MSSEAVSPAQRFAFRTNNQWAQAVKSAQNRDQEHWNAVGKYGVSKIANCMQQSWFQILGKKTENFKPVWEDKKIFTIGTAVHEMVQNYCVEQMGAIKERRVYYKAPDNLFEVQSYVDLIFPVEGVIDIKTTWSKPENYSANSAIHQTNFYMGLTNIKIGGVWVISLYKHFEAFNPEDIWLIPLNFDQNMYCADLSKLRRLTIAVQNCTSPNEYSEEHCKYCQYAMMCPQKVPVAEQDTVYKGYWNSFFREIDEEPQRIREAEQRRRDAIADTMLPKFSADFSTEVFEGLELNFDLEDGK